MENFKIKNCEDSGGGYNGWADDSGRAYCAIYGSDEPQS